VEAAVNIRRRLPKRLPMVCIADPLHLSLQGGARFDLVMWDYGHALEKTLERFAADGIRHPVYVNLSDTDIESQRQAQIAFMGHLAARGAANPSDYIWPWNHASANPAEAWRARQKNLGWAPDAYILQYPWEGELRAQCRKSGFPISAKTPVWAFDDSAGKHHLPMSIRAMADVCAELLLSRLRAPSRPNLVVHINVPVRRRQPQPRAVEPTEPTA
jgi:DNA-binding LacI/PurR family transcriptional regulator